MPWLFRFHIFDFSGLVIQRKHDTRMTEWQCLSCMVSRHVGSWCPALAVLASSGCCKKKLFPCALIGHQNLWFESFEDGCAASLSGSSGMTDHGSCNRKSIVWLPWYKPSPELHSLFLFGIMSSLFFNPDISDLGRVSVRCNNERRDDWIIYYIYT